ncbi:hypothetical protein DFQ27_005255 [Actinomortierella ambigua]|uniref:Ndc10 domain-containing protein n=1 Tax=Actinomortierella ambigua TaxID=1343610 RepID=A0A9P6Q1X7_9FUNG|nr:hypothetical protein DFQ27_005255 [Actinomortierella ambigua]
MARNEVPGKERPFAPISLAPPRRVTRSHTHSHTGEQPLHTATFMVNAPYSPGAGEKRSSGGSGQEAKRRKAGSENDVDGSTVKAASLLAAPLTPEQPLGGDETVGTVDVLETTSHDKTHRRRRLDLPVGSDELNTALKALQYLAVRQRTRMVGFNEDMQIKWKDLIPHAIQEYERGIVMGGMWLDEDDLPVCPIRNTYSVVDHIRLLLDCWLERAPDGDNNDDEDYNETTMTDRLREHLGIAVRHSMLLRDEDLRFLNQQNCTILPVKKDSQQDQTINMLVFHLRRDKSSKDKYGVAIRHNDVRRCSVGAFAFYLFGLWQDPENVPDFLADSWENHKLFYSAKNFYHPLTFQESRNLTAMVLRRQWLRLSYVTVCGRLSGRQEAKGMALPENVLEVGGRFGKPQGSRPMMPASTQPEDHLPFARGMAGFWGKRFHLRRNEVTPSLSLQRMIFPFIEDAIYDPSTLEHVRWIERCRRAMQDADQQDPPDNMDYAPQEAFLLTLARLRRVVLQDAAAYIHIKQTENTWDKFEIPLLRAHPEIFQSTSFHSFQTSVSQALSRIETESPAPPPLSSKTTPPQDPTLDVPNLSQQHVPIVIDLDPSSPPPSPPPSSSFTDTTQVEGTTLPPPQEAESASQPDLDHQKADMNGLTQQATTTTTNLDMKKDEEQCQRIIKLIMPGLETLYGRMEQISQQLVELQSKVESLQSAVVVIGQNTPQQSPITALSTEKTMAPLPNSGDLVRRPAEPSTTPSAPATSTATIMATTTTVVATSATITNTTSSTATIKSTTVSNAATDNISIARNAATRASSRTNSTTNSTLTSNNNKTNNNDDKSRMRPISISPSPPPSMPMPTPSSISSPSSSSSSILTTLGSVEYDRHGFAWPSTVREIWTKVQLFKNEHDRERLMSHLSPSERKMLPRLRRIIEFVEYMAQTRRMTIEDAVEEVEKLKQNSKYSMDLLWRACDSTLKGKKNT